MIIGFKNQFEQPILDGTKIHSMREDLHNRYREGVNLQMATGVRTKKYHQFAQNPCTGTQKIKIQYKSTGSVNVFIDGVLFYYQDSRGFVSEEKSKKNMLLLAKNDGFDSIGSFFAWFNKDFSGKIIHWTPFRYKP